MRAAKIAGLLAGAVLSVSAFCLAANADTVTLTPSQTIALLGNEVQGVVHSASAGNVPCYAIATGLVSSDYTPTNSWANMFLYSSNSFQTYPSFRSAFPDFADRQYVIYAVSPTPRVITGWPSWSASDSSSTSDFTCSFSLPVESCTSMRFSVLYTGVNYVGYYGGTYNTNITMQKSGGVVGRHPLGQQFYTTRIFSAIWPFWTGAASADASNVPENNRESVNLIPLDFSEDEPCSVSGFSLALNMMWAVDVDEGCPMRSFITNDLKIPLLLIECPTISDYVPVTTTTVATTRREYPMGGAQTAAPAQTVDLSHLESGVAAIVQQEQEINNNLDWIGNNVMIGVNNLAYMCNKLDDIYNDMVKRGDIAQNLFPVDGTLLQDIENGLTSYTTAKMPTDATAGLSFWAWFMGKIMEQAWIAELCALGSCLAVTYFILFRGRNS